MENIDLKKKRFEIIVFTLWGLLTLAGVIYHEPWRDEIQAYLIVRDLTIPQIFEQMKYEGHFILWFLFLKPFAILGVEYLSVLSWSLSAFAYGILLLYSPFSKMVKLIVMFSAPFIFWYPIVSRCYVLIPLFLFIIAKLFPYRKKHPVYFGVLLALLANIHLIVEGLVLSVFLFSLYEAWQERKKNRRLFWIPLLTFLGVLFAFMTVIQAPFVSGSYYPKNFDFLQDIPLFCMNLTIQIIGFDYTLNQAMPLNISFAISLICGGMFLYLTKSKWMFFVLAVAWILFICYGYIAASSVIFFGMLSSLLISRKYLLFSLASLVTLLLFLFFCFRFCNLMMYRSFFLFYFLLFFGWLFYDYRSSQDALKARHFLSDFSKKFIPLLLMSVILNFSESVYLYLFQLQFDVRKHILNFLGDFIGNPGTV